jgi:hypothetical protein
MAHSKPPATTSSSSSSSAAAAALEQALPSELRPIAPYLPRGPLLGPPHTHCGAQCLLSYFIGETTVDTDPAQYVRLAERLIRRYRALCEALRTELGAPPPPLLINTMGWVTGQGLDLLFQLAAAALPSAVLALASDSTDKNAPRSTDKTPDGAKASGGEAPPLSTSSSSSSSDRATTAADDGDASGASPLPPPPPPSDDADGHGTAAAKTPKPSSTPRHHRRDSNRDISCYRALAQRSGAVLLSLPPWQPPPPPPPCAGPSTPRAAAAAAAAAAGPGPGGPSLVAAAGRQQHRAAAAPIRHRAVASSAVERRTLALMAYFQTQRRGGGGGGGGESFLRVHWVTVRKALRARRANRRRRRRAHASAGPIGDGSVVPVPGEWRGDSGGGGGVRRGCPSSCGLVAAAAGLHAGAGPPSQLTGTAGDQRRSRGPAGRHHPGG